MGLFNGPNTFEADSVAHPKVSLDKACTWQGRAIGEAIRYEEPAGSLSGPDSYHSFLFVSTLHGDHARRPNVCTAGRHGVELPMGSLSLKYLVSDQVHSKTQRVFWWREKHSPGCALLPLRETAITKNSPRIGRITIGRV